MAVTQRIQGGSGALVSTTTYLMSRLRHFLQKREYDVYTFDRHHTIDKDDDSESDWDDECDIVALDQLMTTTTDMLKILYSEVDKRSLGVARHKVERMAIILDPRFKDKYPELFADVDGVRGVDVARAELQAHFERIAGGAVAAAAATADAPDSESAAAAEAAAAASLPAAAARSSGRTGKRKRMSFLEVEEDRRIAAQARMADRARQQAIAGAVTPEWQRYLAQPREPLSLIFDVAGYWRRKGVEQTDAENDLIIAAEFPVLCRIACQHMSIDATSCEAERNFSSLGLMLGSLRTSMSPPKVEMMMFLRLNRHMIKELARVRAMKEKRQAAQAACSSHK
jgi:hAT family C-terminal dimerisation region